MTTKGSIKMTNEVGGRDKLTVNTSGNVPPNRLKIVLPPGCSSIQRWTVTSGSAVRKGEVVAWAIPLDKPNVNTAPKEAPPPPPPASSRPKNGIGMSLSSLIRKNHETVGKVLGSAKTAGGKSSTNNTSSVSSSSKARRALLSRAQKGSTSALTMANEGTELVRVTSPVDGTLTVTKAPQSSTSASSAVQVVIAYVETVACRHPTVLGGLCAVCGLRPNPLSDTCPNASSSSCNDSSRFRERSGVTVGGGFTMKVTPEEARSLGQADRARLIHRRKLSLVLDLDHTLVHATGDPRARFEKGARTLLLPVPIGPHSGTAQTQLVRHFLKVRPHVDALLQQAGALYEVTIYTAGTRDYAEKVVDLLARHVTGQPCDEEEMRWRSEELRRIMTKKATIEQRLKSLGEEINKPEPTKTKTKAKTSTVEDLENGSSSSSSSSSSLSNSTTAASPQVITINDTDDEDETNGTKKRNRDDQVTDALSHPPPTKARRVTFATPSDEVLKARQELYEIKSSLQYLQTKIAEDKKRDVVAMEWRKKLIGNRIVSRTDVGDLGRDVKSLRRVFPCGGTMAVIVDDREDVWANSNESPLEAGPDYRHRKGEPPANLLLVKPYRYQKFVGFEDVNNAAGTDLSSMAKKFNEEKDEEDDRQMLWTWDVLKRLHSQFYSTKKGLDKRTVPGTLAIMRREILKGCYIVFSGVVPLRPPPGTMDGDDDDDDDDEKERARHPIIRYAEDMGAKVQKDVDRRTTHVVAARDGTEKVLKGREIMECSVVNLKWLMECHWSVSRVPTTPHLLAAVSKKSIKMEEKRKILLSGTDESDEHDEQEEDGGVKTTKLRAPVKTATTEEDDDDDDDDDDDWLGRMGDDLERETQQNGNE